MPQLLTRSGVIISSISVLLTYAMAREFGLVGAVLGSISFDVLMAIIILPLSVKLMGISTNFIMESCYVLKEKYIQKLKSIVF